jgi:hypothetical protein
VSAEAATLPAGSFYASYSAFVSSRVLPQPGIFWSLAVAQDRNLQDERRRGSESLNSVGRASGERIMPCYGPELIQTMRTVLEEVMTRIPVEQATPSVKVHMAEFILKAAAEGQTSYDALLTTAWTQIPTILSMLS